MSEKIEFSEVENMISSLGIRHPSKVVYHFHHSSQGPLLYYFLRET